MYLIFREVPLAIFASLIFIACFECKTNIRKKELKRKKGRKQTRGK